MTNGLSDYSRSYLFQAYERHGDKPFDKEQIDIGIRRYAGPLVSAGYLKKHKTGKTYSITKEGIHYYRLMRFRGQQ